MHVEGAHHARRFVGGPVVGHAAADDHQVAGHQRRGRLLVPAILDLAHADLQVHGAVVAEARAGLAGGGVQGDQAGIEGGQEQPRAAGGGGRRAGGLGRIGEIAQAAAALPAGRFGVGVVLPGVASENGK